MVLGLGSRMVLGLFGSRGLEPRVFCHGFEDVGLKGLFKTTV